MGSPVGCVKKLGASQRITIILSRARAHFFVFWILELMEDITPPVGWLTSCRKPEIRSLREDLAIKPGITQDDVYANEDGSLIDAISYSL